MFFFLNEKTKTPLSLFFLLKVFMNAVPFSNNVHRLGHREEASHLLKEKLNK